MSNNNLPSLETLFGDLDFKKGDDTRSVYSPAAYLADLLQLLEDYFKFPQGEIEGRREDIAKELLLNGDNTFTQIPYLDIVNKLLEARVMGQHNNTPAYDVLKARRYPSNLPFNLENERYKKLLGFVNVGAADLYKLFVPDASMDNNVIAREYLGMTEKEVDIIVNVFDGSVGIVDTFTQLIKDHGLPDNIETITKNGIENSDDKRLKNLIENVGIDNFIAKTGVLSRVATILENVDNFLMIYGITGAELRELLEQNLSKTSLANSNEPNALDFDGQQQREIVEASKFYINRFFGEVYATLNANEEKIVFRPTPRTVEQDSPIDPTWFVEVGRIIRLAKLTGLSLTDLDLILRTCCLGTINDMAIRHIAIIKQIHINYELPIDEICSFISDINIHGIGDEDEPGGLFNNIFNGRLAAIDKTYLRFSEYAPMAFSTYSAIFFSGDILEEPARAYRKRLQVALNISEKDFRYIIQKYRDRYEEGQHLFAADQDFGLSALSLLFRIIKLKEVLDISFVEFFDLLDILEKDPSIRKFAQFSILVNNSTTELDCYRILEGYELDTLVVSNSNIENEGILQKIKDSLWLTQVLLAVGKWMQASDFTAEELKQILTGEAQTEKEKEANQKRKINFLNELYGQFKGVMLDEQLFVSDRFDERSSRAIHRAILESEDRLVSQKDQRIVNYDKALVEKTATLALGQFEKIHPDDFLGLGLEEKMIDKIYNNLTIKGYINANGGLMEEAFPQDPAEFKINFTGEESQALFEVISNIFHAENGNGQPSENGQDDPADIAVFISDLEALELDEVRKAELYDNLIFNGYIDEQGTVLEPDFFADPENIPAFEINAKIDSYSEEVYNLIKKNIDRFGRGKLKLDPEIFAELSLKEIEKLDLIENLVINEYLDEEHYYTDKNDLLSLDIKDLNIAIQFYPHRHRVLNAIKKQLLDFKANYYTIEKGMFAGIAERIVANLVFASLEEEVLEDGLMAEDAKAFFSNPENIDEFRLGRYFLKFDNRSVFNVIGKIINTASNYHLDVTDFTEIGLDETEIEDLALLLIEGRHISYGTIPADKIDFFLNINNALLFNIERFEDFNKDIFFVLHDLAKNIKEGVDEITGRFEALATAQNIVLFNALQDYLEISAPLAGVICGHVFRSPDNIVEELMTPVFTAVNEDEKIINEPDNNKFNFALKRTQQFAYLAAKLGMGEKEADVAFRDQDLVEKFPEKLVMPEGVTGFDALLMDTIDASENDAIESEEEKLEVIYMFIGNKYYIYDAETYNLLNEEAQDLKKLSEVLIDVTEIDAAFIDKKDNSWIIAGTHYFTKEKDRNEWKSEEKDWGMVCSNYDDPEKIEATFVDKDGKTYLFSGDEYIRYTDSGYDNTIDAGYPKKIKGNWEKEFPFVFPDDCNKTEEGDIHEPSEYKHGDNREKHSISDHIAKKQMDAAFHGNDNRTYLFKENKFIVSDNPDTIIDINKLWGKIRNNFAKNKKIKACMPLGKMTRFFAGNQSLDYFDSIENPGVMGLEGTLKDRRNVPIDLADDLEGNLDAAFMGFNGRQYFFKDNLYRGVDNAQTGNGISGEVDEDWGIVQNNIFKDGQIDAAFAGLDGRVYMFRGDQYYRYTGPDYSKVDEGFPRKIPSDWGGLNRVESAFVLDGKTFLFEKDDDGQFNYIQYSTNDYTEPDEGFPKQADDNWWNFPETLTGSDFFNTKDGEKSFIPDAAFIGEDLKNYLFKNRQYIVYDENTRWWSEPELIEEKWDSIPNSFEKIAGAFRGKDGKTYIFEGLNDIITEKEKGENNDDNDNTKTIEASRLLRYIRYSGNQYEKVDNHYPRLINNYWGNVINNIDLNHKIDAAFTIHYTNPDPDPELGEEAENDFTYLFSGDQFFRYTGTEYRNINEGSPKYIDEGYPKKIKTSLKEEPNFENLEHEFENGIDAVFADQRNIYLFEGSKCHIVSNEIYKEYKNKAPQLNQVAYMEEGTIFFEGPKEIITEEGIADNTEANAKKEDLTIDFSRWQRLGNLEGQNGLLLEKAFPPVLRKLPQQFKQFYSEPDAVLLGTDGNSYIFKNADCYNSALEKQYPLAEEWGRVKNNIEVDNRIDAAFTGLDGKTYLFSGDQFVCYEKPEKGKGTPDFTGGTPIFVDGLPKSIMEHFAGLDNVYIAFVKDEKTYLLERPDENGNFRCLTFSGNDYSNLKDVQIYTTDISWWNIPAVYIEEGFAKVDAAFFEEEHIYLINGEKFIHYNREQDLWTYARPLDRVWPKLKFNETDFKSIRTIFRTNEGTAYFFSDEAYVKYENKTLPDPEEIKLKWGLIDNNIVQNEKIDAAFVLDEKTTWLFSGDQYVKYSTSDYHFVDVGYPKIISESLREEEAFKELPQSFDARMEKTSITDEEENKRAVRMDAIVANEGNIYIFENHNLHVLSRSLNRVYDISRLGHLKNNIATNNKVDAAYFDGNDGQTYLFSGDQVFAYEADTPYKKVAEGYPMPIFKIFPGLPLGFQYDLDAALKGTDGNIYFFKEEHFISNSTPTDIIPIKDFWGKINNPFRPVVNGQALKGNIELDAAFIAPNGNFYIFKGNHFGKYTDFENEYLDEGYPLPIENNWGDLPNEYENKINGAFVFEEKTFLIKTPDTGKEEYVRYSDSRYLEMDSIYPQLFINRWGNWNDFLLNDIKIISKYIHLKNEYSGADHTLTDFFYEGDGYKKRPYEMLAEIFDWDIEELKWLKRKNAFIIPENQFEVKFELEQVLNMYEIFRVADKMGADPYDIYDNVWLKRFGADDSLPMPSDAIYRFLGTSNSDKDWQVLKDQFHGEMNLLKRDALVPYVIHITPEIEKPRELSNLMLIDVEMGSEATTSNIKEAISAIQLFIHRYFVSLEENPLDDLTRADFKNWWQWMKNYRVWEANRKVFLYPENYIRPELRDTKTPEFKTLEDELLQGDMEETSVQKAYKNYLDFYTEVSRLKIVGGYSYHLPTDPSTKQLVFFGLTRSNPERYFYRTASFEGGATNKAVWHPWLEVKVKIDSDRVYPVYAFGRLFVFWANWETKVKDTKNVTVNVSDTDDSSGQKITSQNPDEFTVLKIYYSYYNLNKEWMPFQVLQTEEGENVNDLLLEYDGQLDNLKLYVENSNVLGIFDFEHISIKCSYDVKNTVLDEGRIRFNGHLYNVINETVTIDSVVVLKKVKINKYSYWLPFSEPGVYKIKNGKLDLAQSIPNLVNVPYQGMPVSKVYNDVSVNIKTAFQFLPNMLTTVHENQHFPDLNEASLNSFFKSGETLPTTTLQLNTIEKSTDGPWFSFDLKGASFLAKPTVNGLSKSHTLKPLRTEEGRIPKAWTKIDAALHLQSGYSYFFQNSDTTGVGNPPQYMKLAATGAFSSQVAGTTIRWGLPNSILEEVTAAYHDPSNNKTYLFGKSDIGYFSYSDGALEFTDQNGVIATNLAEQFGLAPAQSVNWDQFNAILQDGDGTTYFFRGTQYVAVDNRTNSVELANDLSKPLNIADTWGQAKVRNSFTETGSKVIGAFVYGDNTYLLTDEEYIKYSPFTDPVTSAESKEYVDIDGEAKPNSFLSLLDKMGVTPSGINITSSEKILAAYNDFTVSNDDLRNYSNGGDLQTDPISLNIFFKTDGGPGGSNRAFLLSVINGNNVLSMASDRATESFDLIFSNANISNRIKDGRTVRTALMGLDGSIYIFFDSSYVEIKRDFFQTRFLSIPPRVGEIDSLLEQHSHTVASKWGNVAYNFDWGNLSAAYFDTNKAFVFSGNKYITMSGEKDSDTGVYKFIDKDYPKTLPGATGANPDHLPKGWTQMDAAFKIMDGNDSRVFFFSGNKYTERLIPQNGSPTFPVENGIIKDRWGIVSNKVLVEGVDAAYRDGNNLYLFRDYEYVRYTLTGNAITPQDRIDDGYPKYLQYNVRIAAGFKLGGKTYLFSNDRKYTSLNPNEEPDILRATDFSPIEGNWGNIPLAIRSGIDAALDTGDRLYLFKGDQFVRYGDYPEEADSLVMPFEIGTVKYDIIRLSTSTGYKLNQILFEGGISALLSKKTQELNESPEFTIDPNAIVGTPDTIVLNEARVQQIPNNTYLDFDSSIGIYYWEIFFHAPYLIAQSLNTNQKFEDSKTWFEYIFDPTEAGDYWKFLPFLSVDIEAVISSIKQKITDLGPKTPGSVQVILNRLRREVAPVFRGERQLQDAAILEFDTTKARADISNLEGDDQVKANLLGTMDDIDNLPDQDPSFDVDALIISIKAGFKELEPAIPSSLQTILDDLQQDVTPIFTGEKLLQNEADLVFDTTAARRDISALAGDPQIKDSLLELMGIIDRLPDQHRLLQTPLTQLQTFMDDPFDPHAIAALRRIAYRKAIVMAYIDNLLDWGDMLFRQYSMESINEARMLYVLAYDLLGQKPEGLGKLILSNDKTYEGLKSKYTDDLDFLLEIENGTESPGPNIVLSQQGPVRVLDSILNLYFFIPENEQFTEYWNRVEDRLYKIRQSLNLLGQKQALPLFQPPIDPMSIVSAIGSGASLGQAVAGGQVAVPYYRFDFMLAKAKELVQKLDQFGSELLGALEKKDSEALSLLQSEFEGVILEQTMRTKEAQLEEAKWNINSLESSRQNANDRFVYYRNLIEHGKLTEENKQIDFMTAGAYSHYAAAIGKALASAFSSTPDIYIGPFMVGTKGGGNQLSNILNPLSEAAQGVGEALSMHGEAMGVIAQFKRMKEDWELQELMAKSDLEQIAAQIEGAKYQKDVAQYEIELLEKQIDQNKSVSDFMTSKFSNKQLYQWMASKLSALYYQTYKMAYDMAKYAEKAYQFERAATPKDVNFIQPVYWDSQHKGLLSGAMLGHDLDRMEKHYQETNFRLFEISKEISMLELDPMAFIELKTKGVCEFSLTEALFDYDFPGHYCRQITTISLTFDIGEGVYINATLTQLNNKVVLEADPKAVKFLLQPKGQQPETIRGDWRANQQVALSYFESYEKNNGLFELRFDSDRYLPFEGTGAVSHWRLEINGKKSAYNLNDLVDLIINVKYTSINGGEVFANAVKGMLKPYAATKFIDLNYDFHDQWLAFLDNDSDTLELTFVRDLFPDMASGKITGIFTKFDLFEPGQVSMVINDDDQLTLKDGKFMEPTGLSISSKGSKLKFKVKGDKRLLRTVNFVMGYKAKI